LTRNHIVNKSFLLYCRYLPVVVEAEEASDEDAEDQEDDAGAANDDHRPSGADHVALFEVALNENWKQNNIIIHSNVEFAI
jgi:hypothetical protein